MTELEYKLLKKMNKQFRSHLSLTREFGAEVSDALISLVQKEYLVHEIGAGWTASVNYYEITDKGKDYVKHYCDACECIPCDCDWGN